MISRWLERRIKQRLKSQEQTFFAACAPGLEDIVALELGALGLTGIEKFGGGVEFAGKMETMYLTNLNLRSANRVWLRVDSFRSGSLEDVFKRVKSLRWETLIWPRTPLNIQVYIRDSRLRYTTQVKRAVADGIWAHVKEVEAEQPDYTGIIRSLGRIDHEQRILVTVENNRFRISLDSSGEHLHKRGYRLETAKAPMRETLAAGVILASGWDGNAPFLDPMCGAGTFPIEAALIANQIPPGLKRGFCFENWPVYSEPAWRFMTQQAESGGLKTPPTPIFGRDRNAGAMRISKANAARAGVEQAINFQRADFFSPNVFGSSTNPGYIFMNPPYGKRIEEPGKDELFFKRLGQRLKRNYAGWKVAMVVPHDANIEALGMRPFKRILLDNGGIKVYALFMKA